MMMKTTTLPSPQTWRTTSATAVNPYKQQSTLQSVAWQMGKQTMDNGY
jgi:hypothetical protein